MIGHLESKFPWPFCLWRMQLQGQQNFARWILLLNGSGGPVKLWFLVPGEFLIHDQHMKWRYSGKSLYPTADTGRWSLLEAQSYSAMSMWNDSSAILFWMLWWSRAFDRMLHVNSDLRREPTVFGDSPLSCIVHEWAGMWSAPWHLTSYFAVQTQISRLFSRGRYEWRVSRLFQHYPWAYSS